MLVVINKTDENLGFELNRKFLQDKYPNIKGFYRVSCKTNDSFDILVPALQKALFQVEIIHTIWAASWFAVKTELENMKEPFLSFRQYRDICTREKLMEKVHQDTLLNFLNDLGIILHFKDLELHDTHVLDPKWVTEAVYKIINSKPLAEHSGVLKLNLLEEILKPAKASEYIYPPDKYSYIIDLMVKFELCYKLEGNRILIPNLLAAEECDFNFDYHTSLKFIIDYDFLPPSIMPRFIVRRHRDIKDRLQWRTGVVLEDKAYHAAAVVKCDDRERRISIFVNGEQKRDFFSIIRKTLLDINDSFKQLKTIERVPLPDNPAIAVEYEELTGHEKMRKREITIGKLGKTYPVKQLLDGIEMERERIKNYPGGDGPVEYINYNIDKGFFNPKEVYMEAARSVQFGDNATIYGDFIFAERIRDSFNKVNSAEAPDNLKVLLKSLVGDVEKMIVQLPKEKAEEIVNDLQTFMNEAISKKPRKKWWELSANGIKEAASTVGSIGISVLKNMDKIIPILEKL
ncbi:MAG TPA: COR domain-containing protein [Candidatus Kapabacteria bacterium]|nr:COR domain-containing protein [Candidatus Kapabacteria bacterium]